MSTETTSGKQPDTENDDLSNSKGQNLKTKKEDKPIMVTEHPRPLPPKEELKQEKELKQEEDSKK